MDVNFSGFSRPIVGENTEDSFFYSAVREIISEVRGHALKRFKSVAEMKQIDDAATLKFMSDVETEGVLLCAPIGDELFVYRYECIFAYIGEAVEAYSKNKIECIEMLSCATVEVAKMMTNAAADLKSVKEIRSEVGFLAANARYENDPKQKDKLLVEVCWEAWKKNPDDYTGNRDFARDMQKQFPNLESFRTIAEKWCTKWEAKAKKSNTTLPA